MTLGIDFKDVFRHYFLVASFSFLTLLISTQVIPLVTLFLASLLLLLGSTFVIESIRYFTSIGVNLGGCLALTT